MGMITYTILNIRNALSMEVLNMPLIWFKKIDVKIKNDVTPISILTRKERRFENTKEFMGVIG
jgi:hypothetical protein